MSWPLAVVLIVMMVVIGKVMAAKYRAQGGIITDRKGNQHWIGPGAGSIDTEDRAQTRREVEELRERIKTLEKIATDGNSLDAVETRRIAAEIEALRDQQDELDDQHKG